MKKIYKKIYNIINKDMLNNKGNNKDMLNNKGKNNTRAGVCASLKGGAFILPKVKYTGHH